MGLEIERKFIIEGEPEIPEGVEPVDIEQGYLALEGDLEVRVRRSGERRRLTVKRGSGRTREESEMEVSHEQFEQLWPWTEDRRVSKRRYLLAAEHGEIELDVYGGALEGLRVAEIEFEDEDAAERFEPPGWFGRELTGDPRWANRALAVDGAPEQVRR